MKSLYLISLATIALTSSLPTLAQCPPPPAGKPMAESREALVEMRRQHFANMDQNHDGTLTEEEFMAMPAHRGPMMDDRHEQRMDRFISRHDQQGDGQLQPDELPPFLQQHFDELDLDQSGSLDREELGQMRQRMQAPTPEQRDARIEQHFKALDKDGNGQLSLEEFGRPMRERGGMMPHHGMTRE